MTYNQYGESAIKAVEHLKSMPTLSPSEAWDKATSEIFGNNTTSQKKSCPKNTFLAICETGRIEGVKPGNYSKSKKNKFYAVEGLKLLEQNKEFMDNRMKLWKTIPDCSTLTYNSQMDVVIALYNSTDFLKA